MSQNKIQGHPLANYYSVIYRKYDLVNHLFTFGMDRKWRKMAAIECLKSTPEKIIDLCCGTGDMTLEILKRAGMKAKVSGYDFNDSMLQVARQKTKNKGYEGVEFIQGDVAQMPFGEGEFDSITIAFGFRNLTFENPHQQKYIVEMTRILKKGGKLVIVESAVPSNKFILFFYNFYLHCILIPLGGLISGDWKAYGYLARSSANYYNSNEIEELLVQFGFEVNSIRTFFFGAANLISAIKC